MTQLRHLRQNHFYPQMMRTKMHKYNGLRTTTNNGLLATFEKMTSSKRGKRDVRGEDANRKRPLAAFKKLTTSKRETKTSNG
jgi:hypothetical protein